MSKPREFWIEPEPTKRTTTIGHGTWNVHRAFNKKYHDPCIHTIELTPEVSRKLELFDEAVGFADELRAHFKHIGNFTGMERVGTFLKKLGE